MPDGWTSTTLGADAVLVSGQHILAEDCTDDPTAYPYITGPADFPNGQIQVSKYVRTAKVICEAGDILITAKGSGTGRLVRADRSYCISRQLSAIRPATWDSPFLFHVLSMEQDRLRSAASGLIPGLTRDEILGLPVLVPPLAEQRKIAAILSSKDDAIEATQAVIDQLQVVKKAMMAELLTRGLPSRHTRFKQTDIGGVPEDWEVLPIGDLVESCDYGLSTSLSLDPNGVAVLRMGNLKDGYVSLDDLKFAPRDEVGDDLFLAHGDVLFNRTNSAALVGKVGVFTSTDGAISFASYLLRLRTRTSAADGFWLSAVMNTERNQQRIRSLATPGVSQVNVNRAKMLALAVPVPTVEEQREIVAALAAIDLRLRKETDFLAGLRALKNSLMSVLLTGEVRVTPDESRV